MSRHELDLRDHQMHQLRNRALRRVLASMLRAGLAKSHAARAHALAERREHWPGADMPVDQPRRWPRGASAPLRLVKGKAR